MKALTPHSHGASAPMLDLFFDTVREAPSYQLNLKKIKLTFENINVGKKCPLSLSFLLWHSTEAVAFFTPRPRPYFPCLLSCLVSSIERLSLHGSPNWKIMDLINWSLSAIDTIFSTRSLGFGEPVCPDGTFAAGYTMDAWERWRIVCLAALSVEDIDIYLFGTMITGLLLIGLGFALGYRRIQKTGTAVQSLTRLPVMIEAVGRAVSIETETINRNMDSWLCKGKLMVLETRMDRESSRGIGMRLLAPRLKNRNLIFFGSPVPALASAKAAAGKSTLGRALQWDALAFLPHSTDTCWLQTTTHTHTYTHTYIKICTHLPRLRRFEPPAWQAGLWPAPGMAAGPDGCLPELDYFPCCKVVCLWCMCFCCCWGVFPVLALYSPRSIVWGLFFFLLTFLMLCCIFLQFPVYLHFTTDYTLYDCVCDE